MADEVATADVVAVGDPSDKLRTETDKNTEVLHASAREGEITNEVTTLRGRREPSEEGEECDDEPPLPDEAPPPLPHEDPPAEWKDDGWEPRWDAITSAYYYFNRFTGTSQWENPRVPDATAFGAIGLNPRPSQAPQTDSLIQSGAAPSSPPPDYMGYNPKIHGDFDPNADYAKYHQSPAIPTGQEDLITPSADDIESMYRQTATFNRFTGAFQGKDKGPDRHNDENKSKRQMQAYFDVDEAANAHNGQSLKAQRQKQKLTKRQIQEYNEKRKAKKIKKDRDWLTS